MGVSIFSEPPRRNTSVGVCRPLSACVVLLLSLSSCLIRQAPEIERPETSTLDVMFSIRTTGAVPVSIRDHRGKATQVIQRGSDGRYTLSFPPVLEGAAGTTANLNLVDFNGDAIYKIARVPPGEFASPTGSSIQIVITQGASGFQFDTPRKACTVQILAAVNAGTLSCPRLEDLEGHRIALSMKWSSAALASGTP